MSFDTGILDILQVQLLLCAGNALGTEVVGVVVRHTQEVVASLFQ